jgi:hypothetical protein
MYNSHEVDHCTTHNFEKNTRIINTGVKHNCRSTRSHKIDHDRTLVPCSVFIRIENFILARYFDAMMSLFNCIERISD